MSFQHFNASTNKYKRAAEALGHTHLQKLQEAVFFVLGAGLSGHLVVLNLALLGMKRIIVCDPDQLAPTDISKCLYPESDCNEGLLKVKALKQLVNSQNSEVIFEGYPQAFERVPKNIFIDLVKSDRLIPVLCGDNRHSFVYPASFFAALGVTTYAVAVTSRRLQFQVFRLMPDSGCPACSFSSHDYEIMEDMASCTTNTRSPEAGVPSLFSVACMGVGELMHLIFQESGTDKHSVKVIYSSQKNIGYMSVNMPPSDECPFHFSPVLGDLKVKKHMTIGTLFQACANELGVKPQHLMFDFLWQPSDFCIIKHCWQCGQMIVNLKNSRILECCPLCGAGAAYVKPDLKLRAISYMMLKDNFSIPVASLTLNEGDVFRCVSIKGTLLIVI